MDKAISNVYVTTNYGQFKHLDGNRTVEVRRKNRIKASIEKVGYILNPIVVNENMAVIDGQARLAVFGELNLPVYYVIAEGAGVEECRQLNLGQGNWVTMDFIKSYAEGGNVNYRRILGLIEEYGKVVSFHAILGAMQNRIATGGGIDTPFKDGSITLSVKETNEVRMALDFITAHADCIEHINGDKRAKQSAIAWVLRNAGIDRDRLGKVIDERCAKFKPVAGTSIEVFLQDLSDIYNWHLQPDKCVYLAEEYDRFKRINKIRR